MAELDPPGISVSSDEIDLRAISGAARAPRAWPLIAGVVTLCLLLAVFAESLISDQRRQLLESEAGRLETVALLKANYVQYWFDGLIADAVISAKGVGATMGPLWAAPRESPELAALGARLELLRRAMTYESVSVVDLEGRVVVAAPPTAGRLSFTLPLAGAENPHFVWRPGGESASELSFALVSPLAPSGSDAARGWLVLVTEPTEFLAPLLAAWPGEPPSARTFLASREGDRVWFHEGRRADGAAEPPRAAGADDPLAALVMREGSGPVETADDPARALLAHLVPIRGVPWMLGARLGRAEALATVAAREKRLRAGLLAAVVVALALAAIALRENRRRFEARAARANQRFRTIFANAEEGVLLLDDRARLVDANERARGMFGLAEPFRPGASFEEFVAPSDLAVQPLKLAELARRGSVRSERTLRRRDGETFPAALHSLRLPDGRIVAFVHDLSAVRRVAERERRAKRMASFGTWEVDLRTSEAHWDEETFLVLGYDPAVDRASYETWIARVHPDDRERVAERWRLALADEAVLDFEYRLALPDGRERIVRSVGDVERSENGTALRVEGALQDVTSQRFADAKLAAAQQQLAEAQKTEAVGRLAGSIAHDFNNVVGVIGGFAELAELELGEGHPSGPHLAEIRLAAARAGELTRQLSIFSRRQAPELRLLRIEDVLNEARAPLQQALGSDIELRIESECEPGVATVRADSARIVQVLINLGLNARDAMPAGGRFSLRYRCVDLSPVEVNRHPPLRTGHCVELKVTDTGVGMDEATAARCFEPFFTTKGQGVGSGLGLSWVKSTVDGCGGAIEVASEPGRGTCFTLWLPVGAEERERAAEPAALTQLGRAERVLVVDDVAPMREMVGNILRRAGFRVTLSPDAETALARLTAGPERFDLLLTDVVMPQVSGRDLARQARVARPELRILFMTGHAGLQPDGRPFELPESLLIEKPFTGSELVRRIRASLDAPPELLVQDN